MLTQSRNGKMTATRSPEIQGHSHKEGSPHQENEIWAGVCLL